MINKIVLATDIDIDTPYLLKHAASLSNQYHASLIVVHAIEPLDTLGYNMLQAYLKPQGNRSMIVNGMDTLIEQLRSQLIDILTDEYMAGEIKLPRLEGVVVRPGEPVETILGVTKEVGADMVVLGNRASQTGLGASEVSQKVVNNAEVPVYLIPCVKPVWQGYKPGYKGDRPSPMH